MMDWRSSFRIPGGPALLRVHGPDHGCLWFYPSACAQVDETEASNASATTPKAELLSAR
jgi:hypothetical protein